MSGELLTIGTGKMTTCFSLTAPDISSDIPGSYRSDCTTLDVNHKNNFSWSRFFLTLDINHGTIFSLSRFFLFVSWGGGYFFFHNFSPRLTVFPARLLLFSSRYCNIHSSKWHLMLLDTFDWSQPPALVFPDM